MPNLFFSGSLEMVVSGTAAAVRDVAKAVKASEGSLVINYDEDDVPCTFEIGQWHLQSGTFEIVGVDSKTMRCNFDGIAKVPVTSSAIDFILKRKIAVMIGGVKGNGWNLTPVGNDDGIPCTLNVAAKTPK